MAVAEIVQDIGASRIFRVRRLELCDGVLIVLVRNQIDRVFILIGRGRGVFRRLLGQRLCWVRLSLPGIGPPR